MLSEDLPFHRFMLSGLAVEDVQHAIVITGSLHELQKKLGCSVESIMHVVDERVNDFFIQSLQLDAFTLQLEYE